MKRVFQLSAVIGITLLLMSCTRTHPQATKVSRQPPKVGESMKDVVTRLGPPHGDEGKATQSKAKYVTSYTDSEGTVHHVTVENGIITRVVYTDSR